MKLFICALFSSMLVVALSSALSQVAGNARTMENVDDADSMVLLQASVQDAAAKAEEHKVSNTQEFDDSTADSAKACESLKVGYQASDDVTCSSKVTQSLAPAETSIATPATPQESDITAHVKPELDWENPPGASSFKAVLELMILLLVFDGIRRWRLQRQEVQRQDKANAAFAKREDAADRAWADMIKAIADDDVLGFETALQQRPSMKREDPWGCTALHFAATGGSTQVTADLLNLGAEVDAVDASDETALHFAARAGHVGVCEVLLDKSANVNALNVQDMTPLVVAGNAKQGGACRFLADHGAHAGGMADEDLPPLVVSQLVRKVFESA